ncbi:MAG: glucose-6-phosphate isomerase [Clostridiales bacterium]|nr:glucose-6-phosphate isomerase [Clostridiales bacterium]
MAKRYQNREWKNSMRLRLDYNNMMSEFVGKNEGFTTKEINQVKGKALEALDKIKQSRGKGWLGWTELPYNQAEIVADINATAKKIRKTAKNFVVLGIGGSALGPIAVFQALCHLHYNDLPSRVRKGPKFYVEDNVDPERMKALLDVINVEETVFNVITKSGSTSETMTQYLIIYDLLKQKLGDKAKEHIIATTSANAGNLIKLAKTEDFKTFYIPDGVGGRFSELCPVGLLPAAVLGIDIGEMLAGAQYMDKICMNGTFVKNPALINAALQYIAINKGKNVSVMMPYADGLKFVADWYCQLWAESLGKEVDLNGNRVNAGQTPVKSLGVTDQHSQVQLYTEGPFDKVITFLAVDKYREEVVISNGCEDIPDVHFLCGHTMNELISAERSATEYALTVKERLNHTIYLPEINAFTIGELLYYFEMQTAFEGEMLGVDTYNQPGVENGKNATYALLGRKGYEKKAEELNSAPAKKAEFIC